jgi:hypothetical protein
MNNIDNNNNFGKTKTNLDCSIVDVDGAQYIPSQDVATSNF